MIEIMAFVAIIRHAGHIIIARYQIFIKKWKKYFFLTSGLPNHTFRITEKNRYQKPVEPKKQCRENWQKRVCRSRICAKSMV